MRKNSWLVRPMVVAVSSCFGAAPLWANPTGPQVMHGTAQIQGLGTSHLKVTNSPSAIIHWQGFSIGAGQVTQFVQQSASSAVLNRVVGANISQIHGQLLSNGRVFLINPAGILIGAGAVIDTAGFVGSTLKMLDGDFLAGKLKFQGDGSAGSIVNQGWIKAGAGGNIVLVAPNIQNNGLIQTEGGQIVLAAGQKMTIGSMDLEGVQFEIQAPADSVLNVGKLLADGGAVGVFAGTLKHSGDIRANALTRDEAGRIVLKAQRETTLAGGSTTTANGGKGGDVTVLGDRVSIVDNAAIDASGTNGGGQIRVGGDYQGKNAALQNASRTFVGPNATLRADATASGDGGRIIVWADNTTQYFGNLSARGGPRGGNGGFAEVSGKQHLVFAGGSDLSAPKGALGTLLLDPLDLFIADTGAAVTEFIDAFADVAGNAVTITPAALAAQASNVELQAGRYMRFVNNVDLSNQAGKTLTATVDTWTPTDPRGTPPNQMDIGADITTAGGVVVLSAPSIQTFNTSTISTVGAAAAGANIRLLSNGAISANQLSLNAGAGVITLTGALVDPSTAHSISMNMLTGASVNAMTRGSISTNAITTTGLVDLNSAGGSVTVSGAMATGGGDVRLIASGTNSSVSTQAIDAGSGTVDITARSSIFQTGFDPVTFEPLAITSTNRVNLTTTGGSFGSSINVRVNGGGAVTAGATSSTLGSASVTIGSGTDLNATNVSANATACGNVNFCPGANVNLSATTGSVNVGTVTATALRSTNNFVNESVFIQSGTNPGAAINAMSAASQVKAVNVSLFTGAGTGGGIGSAALPLVVNAERNLTLSTNGAFDVRLNGSTVNQFSFLAGVAPTGGSYSGTVQRSSGGLSLTASATDSTVTIDNPTFAGFNQRAFNSNPFISIGSSSGALNIPTLVVPEGDTTVPPPPPTTIVTAGLPVTVQAAGNLTLGSYTRQSTAESLPKSTSIFSNSGTVTLGTINASKDTVFVSGPAGVTISAASLTSQGDITVSSSNAPDGTPGNIVAGKITSGGTVGLFSTTGNITIGEIDAGGSVNVFSNSGSIAVADIDTSTGSGSVTLAISCVLDTFSGCGTSPAIVGAATGKDDALFEVRTSTTAADGASISVTGQTIGTAGSGNPLDLQSNVIALTSVKEGGRIGFDAAAVQANAPNLTLVAADASTFSGTAGAKFNVTTGATALQNLSVTANPAITAGGVSQVISESRTYQFTNNGASLEFNPGTVPATQFLAGGLLSLTTNRGDISVTSNVNMGAGQLALDARAGDVAAATATFDGAGLFFTAGSGTSNAGLDNQIRTNAIGGTVRPDSVTMTAGRTGSGSVSGSIENTGGINSKDVSLTTFRGGIRVGATGTDNVGSAPGGAIAISALRNGNGNAGTIAVGNIVGTSVSITSQESTASPPVSNTIVTGNITGDSIAIRNIGSATTTGNLNAASSIGIVSRNIVTTGSLDAPAISITRDSLFAFDNPDIRVTGAIGAVRPVANANIQGRPLAITGAVTGASDDAIITLFADDGTLLTIGGPIAAGTDSRISLLSRQGFDFTSIVTGSGSAVFIEASNGPIRQTADGGANGITASSVELRSFGATSAITNTGNAGTDPVDLFGVANLIVNTPGRATFDAHGSTLSLLNLTKGSVAAAPFAISNLTGQTIEMSTGAADATLRVNSPANVLDFSLNYNGGGITLANEGIVTGGGPATVTASGNFVGTVGGVHTSGGSAAIHAASVTTGTIDTTVPATGIGGNITVSGTGNVVTDGDLIAASGPPETAGGSISVSTGTASITRPIAGSPFMRSGSAGFVSLSTGDGAIGTSTEPLLIRSPNVFLSARTGGRAFANLTRTNVLDLRGDDGFVVDSDTAFNNLTVATKGSGTGPLTLTSVPSQTFLFARPTTDNFGAAITAFQVVTADLGASQPATNSARFIPADGDLFIGGGANINVPNLNLETFIATGDIRLQGNSGSALALSNPNQTLFSNRDVLITGNVNITAATAQTIFANRDLTVQARQGTVAMSAPTQEFASTNSGSVSFFGGSASGESVTVTATQRQHIFTPTFGTGSIVLRGGDGPNASVTLEFDGPVNGSLAPQHAEQHLEGGGQVRILGSLNAGGTNSFALLTSNQKQLVRALGQNTIPAGEGSIQLTGGAATDATARIEGTDNNALQQVAEGRCFFSGFSCVPEPYQTPSLTLRGGSGADAFAEIVTTAGSQQVFPTGTLSLFGGTAAGAAARIDNPTANIQNIGEANFNTTSTLIMEGGSATNAYARISAAGQQTIRSTSSATMTAGAGEGAHALILSTGSTPQLVRPGSLTLTGRGSATTTARAEVQAAGSQSFTSVGTLSLNGGVGVDSFARIDTPGNQSISLTSLSMMGGTASGAFAKIDAGGTQSLTGFFGTIGLTAGGTPALPVANAGAIVEGHNQSISCSSCSVTLTGGAGTTGAVSDVSDAAFKNLSGNQSFSSGNLTIVSRFTHSTAGILNPLTAGTQTVTTTGTGGIVMRSDPGALGDAFARIENLAPTLQTLRSSTSSSSGGGIALNNRAAGVVGITSAGRQDLQARFVDVFTDAGSTGNAVLSAADHQFIRTLNGTPVAGVPAASFRVAAVGSGSASVTSAARQLIEVDYFESVTGVNVPGSVIIGNAAGVGTSLVEAPDQSIFAGSMFLLGGTGGGTAAITATSTQAISTVAGGLSLGAGDGAGSKATISAPTQTIVVSGDVLLEGRGAGTVAVSSGGTQIISARGLDVRTLAATGPDTGAKASVCSGSTDACDTFTGAGDQTIHLGGNLGDATAPGIGMRVAAFGTGTAKVQSGGTQTLNVGHPGGVEGQLLIGRLDFGTPVPDDLDPAIRLDPATGNPAAGDSLVIAANQTVNAGSIYIQGPTGADKVSKLSADATQVVTTHVGGITVIGGSALNAFAMIDPTNQTITSAGHLYMQGGSGPNADATIIVTGGPQTVTVLNGHPLSLRGGMGDGADARISGGVPQTINAPGGVMILQGPGGTAGLDPGQQQPGNSAADVITGEIVRERDNLDNVIDESASSENEESRNRGGIQICS